MGRRIFFSICFVGEIRNFNAWLSFDGQFAISAIVGQQLLCLFTVLFGSVLCSPRPQNRDITRSPTPAEMCPMVFTAHARVSG